MEFTREQKIKVCKVLTADHAPSIAATAAGLFPNDPKKIAKMKQMLANWIATYRKALAEKREPFPGKGRRTTVYTITPEQGKMLESISGIFAGK